jgi:histidinol-phosphate aminotransferase
VAQPHLIAQFRKVKDSYNCDALSVAGAAAAIGDQRWLKETRSRIIATRTRLTAALRQLGFDVIESQANFVWAQHKVKPARQLYEQLKAQRVLVRYMEYPGWADGLRITVGTDEQIDVLIALVKEMV